jgi:hypothetical protein
MIKSRFKSESVMNDDEQSPQGSPTRVQEVYNWDSGSAIVSHNKLNHSASNSSHKHSSISSKKNDYLNFERIETSLTLEVPLPNIRIKLNGDDLHSPIIKLH